MIFAVLELRLLPSHLVINWPAFTIYKLVYYVYYYRRHRRTTCGLLLQTVYCSMVCRSVCRCDTVVSPVKMAEPIEMPFGLWALKSSKNHCIRWDHGSADAPVGRDTFRGVSSPVQSIGFRGLGKMVSCAKRVDRS